MLDFECTCDKGTTERSEKGSARSVESVESVGPVGPVGCFRYRRKFRHEIIEFPVVFLNSETLEVLPPWLTNGC